VLTVDESIRSAAKFLDESGVDAPRADAELLMAKVLGVERAQLVARGLAFPTDSQQQMFNRWVARRGERREPLAYILGSWQFFGLEFTVTPSVLVPRPETEVLVERALEIVGDREALVADIGTGSGAIAVAVAANSKARVVATDVSARAIEIAKGNARGAVEFRQGSMFDPLGAETFDLVCCNPPYIADDDYDGLPPELRWEPRLALACGDGLVYHRLLAEGARRRLRGGGVILVEVGAGQAGKVKEFFYTAGFANVQFHKDLASIDRVVEAW
jgi:release factor glutamine methyltransferase